MKGEHLHIVLDLQACQSPESGRRGIGRYSLALAKAMAANPRGHRFSLLLNAAMSESIESMRKHFEHLVPDRDIVVWHGLDSSAFIHPDNAFRRRASELLRLDALRRLNPDVVHVASLFEGVADNVTCTISRNEPWLTAVTLYDLIPLSHQEAYLADPRIKSWYMEKLAYLRHADQLLGISAFSCDEATQLLSPLDASVSDISGAADAIFRRLPDAELHRGGLMVRYGIGKAFILYAGGFDARKNIAALIRAFARLPRELRDSHQLVIVGGAPAPEKSALQSVVQQSGLDDQDVVFAGFVPDEDLVKLYNLCALYVFASLQEGFGLPALEAMSSGAVVIGSDSSSLPEVIGFREALFDPKDDGAITAAMQMALTDYDFRRRFLDHAVRQSKRFSWEESARRALDSIEAVWSIKGTERQSVAASGVRALARPTSSRIDVKSGAKGAAALKLASAKAADLMLSSPSPGQALEVLSRTDRGLVVELVCRASGCAGARQAILGGFRGDVLDALVPPSALAALGESQVIYPSAVANRWRDEVEAMVVALRESPAAAASSQQDWLAVAGSLAAQQPRLGQMPRWFVDISNLAIHDAGTGIQRVVRHVLDELITSAPPGYVVEPVYMNDAGVIHYARSYCSKRYLQGESLPPDEAVDMRSGDVFLGLDLIAHLVPSHLGVFKRLRDRGVKLHFVVYDLLPVLRSDCFEPHLLPYFRSWYEAIAVVADGIVCISRSVADEFEYWLNQSQPERLRALRIGWFHLGADWAEPAVAEQAVATAGAHRTEFDALGERRTFLMVGTVEPRKGHAQALAAFELLWERDADVNLVIIGKPGWLTESLVERLRSHPMRGRRLFWFEKAGDDLLQAAYRRASALLNPSEGEGFGLPLIEAAHHGLPLIIRDLPVFREVAGDHAVYFHGSEPLAIAAAVDQWVELDACGQVPSPSGIKWLTWSQASAQLIEVITEQRWTHQWRPGPRRIFNAYDYRFHTQVGRLVQGRVVSTGERGYLFYGPYLPLQAGHYEVELFGAGCARGWVDVCSSGGEATHARQEFDLEQASADARAFPLKLEFDLDRAVSNIEIRMFVEAGADVQLERIVLCDIGTEETDGLDDVPPFSAPVVEQVG
ncbi:glycosyltransferase family 1 protein [Pseudoxanthomonas sp. X-1]|uniref:glycosyltransferase family 4 protein n=1 Tax=Pseudoxanthomonas sp. X-1 TaxID=2571115 RepID=UPI0014862062|nr:glycosyltransferase family 1 protein [Pseudoxanthomonas sp. X-1]UAY74174.1 glycosyltransferase family 4 protein [Pseudoxanthomonas sp. X-1]